MTDAEFKLIDIAHKMLGGEVEPNYWVCTQCGATFGEETTSHSRAEHRPHCDGTCHNCPIEVECGPVISNRDRSDVARECECCGKRRMTVSGGGDTEGGESGPAEADPAACQQCRAGFEYESLEGWDCEVCGGRIEWRRGEGHRVLVLTCPDWCDGGYETREEP